jgi:two-component system nitrogen regulation response regulator GlnG
MTNTRPGRILVVDDEADVRRIIEDALGEDGHEIVCAPDGETGLELLGGEPFDLAFVDINLPGLSGFDLLDRYSESEGDTAIVIVTGRATVTNAIEATRRGAYDYVTKPFDLDDLRLLAARVLERQAMQSQLRTLRERTRSEFAPGVEIIGQSPEMNEIYKIIGRVSESPATVLIQGESGTGKEIVARVLRPLGSAFRRRQLQRDSTGSSRK